MRIEIKINIENKYARKYKTLCYKIFIRDIHENHMDIYKFMNSLKIFCIEYRYTILNI